MTQRRSPLRAMASVLDAAIEAVLDAPDQEIIEQARAERASTEAIRGLIVRALSSAGQDTSGQDTSGQQDGDEPPPPGHGFGSPPARRN
jgi:hypothetical protein